MAQPLGLDSEIVGLSPFVVQDNPLQSELIHAFPAKGPSSYRYSPDLLRWCRDNLNRFDGVMLHGSWSHANWTVSRECLIVGIPYIAFPHGMLDLWSVRGQGWVKRLKKELYWHYREKYIMEKSCAIFFTLARELENTRLTFVLPEVARMIVVPYGVSMGCETEEMPASVTVRQTPGVKIALFLGRIHPKKRPDLLMHAWKDACLGPEWRLIVAGPGEPTYLAHLEGLAHECGIKSAVQFTGPVAGADKRYLLHRAEWFLLPSEQENFGIAVLEAADAGCAIAISDQVYLADEFPPGSEILPVQTEVWSRFMRERMTDDVWRNETARRVQEQLRRKFGAEAVRLGWVNSITQALQ